MRISLLQLPIFILAAVAQDDDPTDDPVDLQIDVTHAVQCDRRSQTGDVISVNYRGTFTNGTEFDSTSGSEPFNFTLGAGDVIAGFDAGLMDMCIGEERTLTIAPDFAYGDKDVGPIPAKSTLIFYTELVGIEGVATTSS